MVLLPESLKALKRVAKEVGLDLRGASLNLDGGFDSAHNRKCIFNAGLIPNIKENPRNRKTTKRGRKRFFNEAIHVLRMRVERTFAWEDKFKRLRGWPGPPRSGHSPRNDSRAPCAPPRPPAPGRSSGVQAPYVAWSRQTSAPRTCGA